MSNETRKELERFFRSPNSALAELLLRHCRRVPLDDSNDAEHAAVSEGATRTSAAAAKEYTSWGAVLRVQSAGGLIEIPGASARHGASWLVSGASETFQRAFVVRDSTQQRDQRTARM